MNGPALTAAYEQLKRGSLWSSTGKCRGYAVANPGEAQQIDAYVAALAAGHSPAPPTLATYTGSGIVAMLAAMVAPPPPPPFTVAITGTPKTGQTLTAVVVPS